MSTSTSTSYKRLENNGDCYHVITYTIEDGVEKFISRELFINNYISDTENNNSEENHKLETEKYLNIIKKENEELNYNFHEIIYKYPNKYF